MMHVAQPAHWSALDHVKVHGRQLTPGRLVSVAGERGKFAFVRHVVNEQTGAEWLDVRNVDTRCLRSFRPERVRRVHKGTDSR